MRKILKAGIALSFTLAMAGIARADISVATVGPITGQYATFGAQLKAGAEQAVADINAAGGVLGQKLVLEVGDDACDPKQAVAVANQLVAKGVALRCRALLLRLVDPRLVGLLRCRCHSDLAGFDQPGIHRRASRPRHVPRLRP